MGEEQPLLDAIAEFTEKLAGSKMSLQRYRILIMELITELSRFGANNQINLEDVFGGNGDVYTRAMQLESTDALREWLCENCLKLQKQVQNFLTTALKQTRTYVSTCLLQRIPSLNS